MASTEDLQPAADGTTGTEAPAAAAGSAAGVAAPEAAPDATDAGMPPAPARPRRTRKKAAPAPAMAAESVVSPDTTAPADAVGTAATAEAQPAEAQPAEAREAVAATAAPVKAARKRTPRKRAVAATAPVSAPAEPVSPDAEATGDPSLSDVAADAPTVTPDEAARSSDAAFGMGGPESTDVTEEVTEDGDATAEEATAYPSVVTVPSFGVLFQAPAPAPARRAPRRASSPVATVFEPPTPTEAPPAAEVDDTLVEDLDPGHLPDPTDDDGEETTQSGRRRRRRGGKGRRGRPIDDTGEGSDDTQTGSADELASAATQNDADAGAEGDDSAIGDDDGGDGGDGGDGAGAGGTRRRTRRRRRTGSAAAETDDAPGVVTRVRAPRPERDEVTGVRGSTRLEAKRQRRREGREAGRRRTIITEAEFLARRESVERVMVVRAAEGRTQIGVLEDNVLVEHYVSRETTTTMAGNIYLGRVQNVLPSMEAAFVDIGRGRNAVLYAGEVNWDAAGLESGSAKRIENALESGQSVLVQVTKDPIGHKGARLTSQISLPGRYLVYVPDSSMTGISRKLPDTERARLKRILRDVVPESAGVIVRTAAEGASEEELRADVERLTAIWERIKAKADSVINGRKGKGGGSAPMLVHGEPDMTVRVIRDVFNEDFTQLVVSGDEAWTEVSDYVASVAPDLAPRLLKWTSEGDIFGHYRIHEQIAKAMDRKVWLPSGGSLVIDRTEAMTVVDVNTGKFVGSGGNLEETVTRNNIEAAEEIVRQLRLRDIGGIIVIDFIDMVLESNRDLVVRRLLECLGRDRTKHQVAEVTSLGLVQMTRKRVGSGLIEVFSDSCEHCNGRGYVIHSEPIERPGGAAPEPAPAASPAPGAAAPQRSRSRRGRAGMPADQAPAKLPAPAPGGPTPAQIAAAAHAAAMKSNAAGESTERTESTEAVQIVEASEVAASPEVVESTELGAAGQAIETGEAAETAETGAALAGNPAEQSADGTLAPDAAMEVTPQDSADSQDPEDETAHTPAPVTTAPVSGRARRRRGRVVAPAGPPRPGDGSGPTS